MNILIEYIKSNDLLSLQKRLNKVDINVIDESNNTLLHYSIKYHRYEISYYLINKGINLNVINNYGYTPLSLAVKLNLFNIVSALTQNNANPLIYNQNLEDSIYLAYLYGRENIITYFENKYDYDYKKSNKHGENLLFALVRSHNYKLVTKYINSNNIYSKDHYGNTLLMIAVKISDINICKYLLSISQGNINMYNSTRLLAIDYAIDNKDKNIIRLLLRNGAFTSFYFSNKDLKENISAIEPSLLDYDLTLSYSTNYKLIYYMLENDINMFSKYINYNNIYINDYFDKNIIDYIKIYGFNTKNNKFYQVLCHLVKKLL